jgi:hypothetical protein
MIKKMFATLIIFNLASLAYAQGEIIINPLSNYETDVNKSLNFSINNRKRVPADVNLKHMCDVNGVSYEGVECFNYFKLSFSMEANKDTGFFSIPANDKVEVTVALSNTAVNYAIYKPLISPVAKKEQTYDNTVTFDFNYQPGMLFVVNKTKEKIELVDTKYVTEDNVKRMKTKINLAKLNIPKVVSISAKIIEKDTNNFVRLVKLATLKILDPKRDALEMYADYETSKYDKAVCYQAYVQDFITQEVYQLSDCEGKI